MNFIEKRDKFGITIEYLYTGKNILPSFIKYVRSIYKTGGFIRK